MQVDIRGFPNYQINTNGDVYSKKRGIYLKPFKDGWGYPRVTISHDGVSINKHMHRLVAEAFIPNPSNKPEVNHIDGNKKNNDISNLEWVTRSENEKHAFITGLNNRSSYNAGKQKQKVMLMETGMCFDSISECANYLHCSHGAVIHCLKYGHKTRTGYTIKNIY